MPTAPTLNQTQPVATANDGTQLDPSVVALAKSIRSVESGAKYDASGKSGEYGAYQYTMPTWKQDAKKYLGDENADINDPVNQDKAAYYSIKAMKDQGYTPEQIASIWNSGKPDPTGNVGTNDYGVHYDTPAYVKNVIDQYSKEKEAYLAQNQPQEGPDIGGIPKPVPPAFMGSVGGGAQQQASGNWLVDLLNSVTDPFSSHGGGIMNAIDAGTTAIGLPYFKGPGAKTKSVFGGETDTTGYRNGQKLDAADTATQALGNVVQAGATVALPEARAIEGVGLLGKGIQAAKFGAKVGGATGFGHALSKGEDLPNTVVDTLEGAASGGALGFGGGALFGGLAAKTPEGTAAVNQKLVDNVKKELGKLEDYSSISKVVNKAAESGIDVKQSAIDSNVLKNAVDENGVIHTLGEDGAHAQYQNAIKPMESVVRDAIAVEKKKIPLTDIEKALKSAIDNSGLEGGALERAQHEVEQDLTGYAKRADKNGMVPLEKVHDFKVDKYANINYMNPEAKKSGKAIARALKGIVEDNSSADVKSLNKELQKHYTTLKYLEKLDGKRVEGGKLGKYVAQMVGAAAGSHFGPLGPIVGAEVAGKVKGKMLAGKLGGSKDLGEGIVQSDLMKKTIKNNTAKKYEANIQKQAQDLIKAKQAPEVPPLYNEPYKPDNELPTIKSSAKTKPPVSSIPVINADKMAPPNVASIPVIITNKMRADLADLGYTKEEVGKMTPIKANEILKNKTSPNRGSSPRGFIDPKVLAGLGIGSAALFGGAGALSKSGVLNSTPQVYQAEKPQIDVPAVMDAIAYNESRGQKEPYSFSKPSGSTTQGDALGKYQITEGELKTYGKKYLGKVPTKKEFLSNPKLQDDFMENKIEDRIKQGLNVEELFATHRGGLKDPPAKVKSFAGYVESGLKKYKELTEK